MAYVKMKGQNVVCSDLALRSEGLLQRVNTVVDLQHKASRVMVHLLGAQYTLGVPFLASPPV